MEPAKASTKSTKVDLRPTANLSHWNCIFRNSNSERLQENAASRRYDARLAAVVFTHPPHFVISVRT